MCSSDLLVKDAQQQYRADIRIHLGFELDYIEGFEAATTHFLNEYGPVIDDAILSVHMLKTTDQQYVCLDYSRDEFQRIIQLFGSVQTVYEHYFQTVKRSILADLGPYKPTRIGHLTLVHKFQKSFPLDMISHQSLLNELLELLKEKDYSLDLNTAGLYKSDCQEIYPSPAIAKQALEMGIELKPGSDSHEAATIARGFEQLKTLLP